MITSRALAPQAAMMRQALSTAIASLPDQTRNALLLCGFTIRQQEAYASFAAAYDKTAWLVGP